MIQLKARSVKLFLMSLLLLFCQGCFLLNPYVYTDQEIDTHYSNKKVKPSFTYLPFLGYKMHYAKIALQDTLPLLVFIHGAPGAWYGYMDLMDDSTLQRNFKMIAVDRIGYGKSNAGKAELSTQMQALSILTIIQKENTSNKKVYLLGRSYGAPIAAFIAIHYPQIVEHLYMVSPVIDPKAEKFYWFSPLGKTAIMQCLLPSFLNVATKEKYAHVAEMKKMRNQWKKLFVPTTVLVGENDHIADTANFSFAKKQITTCVTNFYKLKNTGHLITYEKPALIKQLLLQPDRRLKGFE